jgi:hypothetical protein
VWIFENSGLDQTKDLMLLPKSYGEKNSLYSGLFAVIEGLVKQAQSVSLGSCWRHYYTKNLMLASMCSLVRGERYEYTILSLS